MARERHWSALSAGYRGRLERAGITRDAYESGAPLSAARGHAATPEHPSDAERRPTQFEEYRARKSGLSGKEINVITTNGVEMIRLNAKDRSTVGRHWAAVQKWMRTGEGDLASFNGQTVRDLDTKKRVQLETDPMAIWVYTRTRQTNIPSIYERQ